MTQGNFDADGRPVNSYADDVEIRKWSNHWKAMDNKANPRFNDKTAASKSSRIVVPGGLDGEADGYFWRDEVLSMVAEDILPEGIRVIYNGRLCAVVGGKIIRVKQ